MDVALCSMASGTNQSSSTSSLSRRRPLEHRASIVANRSGEVIEHFFCEVESSE